MKQTLLQCTIFFLSVTSFLLPSNSPVSHALAPHEKPSAAAANDEIVPHRDILPLKVSALDATARPTFVFPPDESVAHTASGSTSMFPIVTMMAESVDSASNDVRPRRSSQHTNAIQAAKIAIIAFRPRAANLSTSQRRSSSRNESAAASSLSDTRLAEFISLDGSSTTPEGTKRKHDEPIRQARLSITTLQQSGSQASRSEATAITPRDDDDDIDHSLLSRNHLLEGGVFTASAALAAVAMNQMSTSSQEQPVKRFMTGLEIPAAIKGASFFANACAFTAAGVTTIYGLRRANEWLHSGCEAEKDLAVKRAREEFQKMLAETVRQFNSRFEAVAIDIQELAEVQQDNTDKTSDALHHIGDALVALGSTADVTTTQADIVQDASRLAHERAIAAHGGLTATQQLAGQAHSTASAAALTANNALEAVRRIGEELQQQQLVATKKPDAIKAIDIPVTAKEEPKGCWCC